MRAGITRQLRTGGPPRLPPPASPFCTSLPISVSLLLPLPPSVPPPLSTPAWHLHLLRGLWGCGEQPLLAVDGMISLGGGMPNAETFPLEGASFTVRGGHTMELTAAELNAALSGTGVDIVIYFV